MVTVSVENRSRIYEFGSAEVHSHSLHDNACGIAEIKQAIFRYEDIQMQRENLTAPSGRWIYQGIVPRGGQVHGLQGFESFDAH